MSVLTKTNFDGTKHLRYELEASMFQTWLDGLEVGGERPYALYFELKRKTTTGMVNLDHIEIVPVYLDLPGNFREPLQALKLSIGSQGVDLVSFPNGTNITSIPNQDKPDYRALEQFVDRVGIVMFSYQTLKYMVDNSSKIFISSLLFDPRTFQFNMNPEDQANYPVYTLKVEIEPVSLGAPPSPKPMDNLYPPYLVGTPCTVNWYNQTS